MAKIWISYRRSDSEAMAGRIFDRLGAHFGKEAVFRDIDNIPVGIDFRQHIGDTLAKAGVVIAIVGPQWLGPVDGRLRINELNDPVRVEVETALRRRVSLIPVLIGETRMPNAEQLPPSLMDFSYRNAIKVDPGLDFDHHMERLIRAVEAILADRTKPTARAGERKAATGEIKSSLDATQSKTSTGERRQTQLRPRVDADTERKTAALAGVAAGLPHRIKAWSPLTRQGRIVWIAIAVLVAVPLLILTTVISGSGVRLWSGGDDWQSAGTLTGHSGRVSALAFSPNGRRMASASSDKSVKVWDVDGDQLLLTLAARSGAVSSVAFSPDGKLIISAGQDGSILVSDADNGQTIRTFKYTPSYAWDNPNSPVWSVAVSPDGRRIASGSADSSVRIWDLKNPQEPPRTLKGHTDEVMWVAFMADGKRLVSASKDGTLHIWDIEAGRTAVTLAAHLPPAALSSEGKRLAAVDGTNAVTVWDTAGFSTVRTIPGQGALDALAFSRGGRRLAGGARDGSVHVWDVQNGQTLAILKGHTGSVEALAFSSDGRRMASGSDDKTIRMWMN
jgi:WD40 repeat protein